MTDETGLSIHIDQLELMAHVGVPEKERVTPQRLTVSMTLWPLLADAGLHDNIARTVDYAAVCTETKRFVDERRDKLIETLANAVAMHLLEGFEIRRITIEVRKFILPDVKFVSVTLTRDRSAK